MGRQGVRVFAAGLVLALAVFGCGEKEAPEYDESEYEGALAIIDGEPLMPAVIDSRLENMAPEIRKDFDNPSMLSSFIDREINMRVWARAGEDAGIEESQEYKTLINNARTTILAELYNRGVRGKAAALSERDLREAYERDKHLYTRPGNVEARHILCETEEAAREALEAVEGGMPFEEAAERYSIDRYTSDKGGDLGTLTRESPIPGLGVSPEFYESVSSIEAGKVGGPIRTARGFHVVQVLGKRSDEVRPFSEVKGQLERRLTRDLAEQGEVQDLRALWDRYDVKVNETAIKKYVGYPVTPEEFIRQVREATSPADKITLCENMLSQFPDSQYAAYAQFLRGFTYSEELRNYIEALKSFEWIIEKHPDSKLVPAARWMIENMQKEHPPLRNVEHVVEIAERAGN